MASMAYAVKAEPAENEALKGEGVKRSRKLYWPVDCVYGRERRVHKGALLELSAIKYCLEATKEAAGGRKATANPFVSIYIFIVGRS